MLIVTVQVVLCAILCSMQAVKVTAWIEWTVDENAYNT